MRLFRNGVLVALPAGVDAGRLDGRRGLRVVRNPEAPEDAFLFIDATPPMTREAKRLLRAAIHSTTPRGRLESMCARAGRIPCDLPERAEALAVLARARSVLKRHPTEATLLHAELNEAARWLDQADRRLHARQLRAQRAEAGRKGGRESGETRRERTTGRAGEWTTADVMTAWRLAAAERGERWAAGAVAPQFGITPGHVRRIVKKSRAARN